MIRPNKSTVSRRAEILKELDEKGKVFVHELSDKFNISEVTIRNDLDHLEKQNMLIRARGGAIKIKQYHVGLDISLTDKQKEFMKEKQRIGKRAAQFIENGDTIILDSGTTTTEVAKNLGNFKELTIITNALNIAGILSEYEHFNVFIPGGILRKKSLSFVGSLAEESLSKFYCDKLFLGVDGFDITYGLSTPNVEEARLNKIMIDLAEEVIVVTDSRKFQNRKFAFIAPVTEVDVVITDAGIPEEVKSQLEKSGIDVVIA